jgi:nucleoside-diphosphate-sugar epimerase
LAAQSDVVLNLADADDIKLAKAVNSGLSQRAQADRSRQPLLIHTSGTSVLSDPKHDDGTEPAKHTYSDEAPEDFWSLPDTAPHHAIDLEVLKAQDLGINTLVVIPCTIVGIGSGINKMSVQVPALISAALQREKDPQAGTVGTGANEWPFIHVLDLAEAYALLLSKAVGLDLNTGRPVTESTPPLTYGRQGIVYPASGHYVHKELAALVGKTLHRLAPDVVKTAEVRPFEQNDIDSALYGKYVGMVFGGGVRVSCDKLPKLGWKPTHPGLEVTVEQDARHQIERLRKGQLSGSKVSMDK